MAKTGMLSKKNMTKIKSRIRIFKQKQLSNKQQIIFFKEKPVERQTEGVGNKKQ